MWWIILLVTFAEPQPGFPGPELPEGYTWWYSYKGIYPEHYIRGYRHRGIRKPELSDTSWVPFTIDLPGFEFYRGSADSLSGGIHYSPHPEIYDYWDYRGMIGGRVVIEWISHLRAEPTRGKIAYDLIYTLKTAKANWLSLDKKGVKKLTIDDRDAYRLRGFWHWSQCDMRDVNIGAVTAYFIPTDTYDFFICCYNIIYQRCNPLQGDFSEDTYPNNIAELERAVEQTFRVK